MTRAMPWIEVCLAALSGVLVFIAFPNWNHSWTVWFSLVPVLFAARHASVKRGLALGLIAGTVTNFGGFHWITEMLQDFGHMPAVAAWSILGLQAVTQGLSMAIGVGLWRYVTRRGAPSAVSAFACMWFGEVVTPMIFPWHMGNSLVSQLPMVQIADLGGVHLVSAQVFAVNAAIAQGLISATSRRPIPLRFIAVVVSACVLSFIYGHIRIGQVTEAQGKAKQLRVGLVEANVGIWEKEGRLLSREQRYLTLRHNLLKHQQMSADLERRGAELILWPESAYQPIGPLATTRTTDRFVLVGDRGVALRADSHDLIPLRRGQSGLPETTELLSGLSSPRGDLWRAIVGGERILTYSPWETWLQPLPAGEVAVDTAAVGVNARGATPDGVVLTRRGKIYQLPWPKEPTKPTKSTGGPRPPLSAGGAHAELQLLPMSPDYAKGRHDMAAIGCSGAGAVVAVGRGGALASLRAGRVDWEKSPTTADLWDVAGDPGGRALIAVGDAGAVVFGSPGRWSVERAGTQRLNACWFDGEGVAWAVGHKGTLMRRSLKGRWRQVKAPTTEDLLAGHSDARGHVMIAARGGGVWERDGAGRWRSRQETGPEITHIWGHQRESSYLVPRSARRVPPSRVPLPPAKLAFPENVRWDQETSPLDSNAPRRGFKTPLLMGAMTFGGVWPRQRGACEACYNSAMLLGPDGEILDMVDKTFLLVFGEYMPLGERYPELYDLLPESSRFQPGDRTTPMQFGEFKIGVMICYEDLLPRYGLRLASHDPHVFINLTNDAWFGQTAEPYHHLQLAQLRTVEYRRWLVRSTNTGVSAFVDATGQVVKQTHLTDAETLLESVPMMESKTVYARLGDWPVWLLCVGLLLLWGRSVRAGPKDTQQAKGKGRGGPKARAKASPPASKPKRSKSPSAAKPKRPARSKPGKVEVLEPDRLS